MSIDAIDGAHGAYGEFLARKTRVHTATGIKATDIGPMHPALFPWQPDLFAAGSRDDRIEAGGGKVRQ